MIKRTVYHDQPSVLLTTPLMMEYFKPMVLHETKSGPKIVVTKNGHTYELQSGIHYKINWENNHITFNENADLTGVTLISILASTHDTLTNKCSNKKSNQLNYHNILPKRARRW